MERFVPVSEMPARLGAPPHDLVVNTVPLVVDFVMPVLMRISALHAEVCFHFRLSVAFTDLGAAGMPAIALRAGDASGVAGAEFLGSLRFGLYATEDYIRRHGHAEEPADLARHVLVDQDHAEGPRAPFERWLTREAPQAHVALRTNDEAAQRFAIRSGHCAGFLPFAALLWNPGLRAVMPSDPSWHVPLWLVRPPSAPLEAPVEAAASALGAMLARCLG